MKLKQNKAKMYRIIGERDEQQLKEVLNLINLRKNGIVVDSMKAAGLTYKVSFGVSVVDMRTLVRPYKNNNVLTRLLWGKGWRETYMAATMIANADTIDAKVLLKWAEEIPNYEVAEQFGNNLLYKTKDPTVFNILLNTKSNLVRTAIFKAFSRKFMLNDVVLSDFFKQIINIDLLNPEKDRKLMAIALGQAIAFLARKKLQSSIEIEEIIKKSFWDCNDFNSTLEIIKNEVNYLNSRR